MASTGTVAEQVAESYPRLRGVIHTAAVLTRRREETEEGLERMFATNLLAPFLLTRILLDRLPRERSLRVVVLTAPSTTPVDLDDLQSIRRFRSLSTFGATKTADLLFVYALARRLSGSSRTANAFFPGVVRSSLLKEAPWVVRAFSRAIGSSADSAGESLAWLMTGAPLAQANGAFFEGTRVGSTSDYTRDAGPQERLWHESERLLARLGV